ncbi:hypothetical protein ACIGO6_38665 [Streptomyces sp. NPDC053750]|uniref:hypothetical protein n=1 Tax=Streptomyces sp. NPDC053750 TaxID=3365714 RepID=UPI0037D98781
MGSQIRWPLGGNRRRKLAGLAFRIEELLGDGHGHQASELAAATATWLQQAAPHAEELAPDIGELAGLMAPHAP